MSKNNFFTVVLEVTDPEAAKPFLKMLSSSMAGGTIPGVRVTAFGAGDEMTKLEKLLDLCDSENLYVPEELRA